MAPPSADTVPPVPGPLLKDLRVHIERCVFFEPHEAAQRATLVKKIHALSATVHTTLLTADIVLCDASRTVLDEVLRAAPGHLLRHDYIDLVYRSNTLPDLPRWKLPL
ncbi:hypothetical protein AURDEDRAFT_174126 [Auricularia subglabra TFB-10046 SS5]|nr:hypothetical protein AURDEDRAFT_174126 [Auricularia subglabra TFB-10046 SS5]